MQSSPAVANGVVYVGSYDQQLLCAERQHRRQAVELCHRIANGYRRPLWRMGWFMSSSSLRNLYALNASTGAKLWSYTPGGYVWPSPAVVNGVVYFNAFDASGQLHVYAFGLVQPADLYLRIDPHPTPYIKAICSRMPSRYGISARTTQTTKC